jgi:lactam utilization protein B
LIASAGDWEWQVIDPNSDLGESFGASGMGEDAAMCDAVSGVIDPVARAVWK